MPSIRRPFARLLFAFAAATILITSCGEQTQTVETPPPGLYGPEAGCTPQPGFAVPAGPRAETLTIDCRSDVVIDGLTISSSAGDCIVVTNSVNVTIRNSQIGPCAGNAIEGSNNTNLRILDSYLHSEKQGAECCDHGNNIWLRRSSEVLIQGNVIAFGETNVELQAVSDARLVGNFLLNPLGPFPRGQQVQVWSIDEERSADVVIEKNYALSSADRTAYPYVEDQEDAFNVGFSDRIRIEGNFVRGGRSPSGCAYLIDQDANLVEIRGNVAYDIGQCGIGVSSGRGHVIDGNRVYSEGSVSEGGNTAIYVWKQSDSKCGPVHVTNNVAVLIRSGGQLSSWWNGGGCSGLKESKNTWDAAAKQALTPADARIPAPSSIPPLPFSMKVSSPYSR